MIKNNETTTLIDRLALGFGSGVIAFITGTILWVSLHLLFAKAGEFGVILPFYSVWLFSGIGFILGALTLEDYLLKLLTPVWSFVYKYAVILFH